MGEKEKAKETRSHAPSSNLTCAWSWNFPSWPIPAKASYIARPRTDPVHERLKKKGNKGKTTR